MVNGYEQGRALFLSRRMLLRAGLSASLLPFLAGCSVTTGNPLSPTDIAQGKEAAPGRKTVLNLYSVFGSNEAIGWVKLAQRYEEAQSEVGIKITYSPQAGSSSDNPKLFTAIAGDTPPDLAHLVPGMTPQWATLGVLTDLSQYMQASGLTRDDFWDAAWNDMNYQGKTWQVQWDADPNFPFFWNKNLFAEVGLDPEQAPQTVDEMSEYADRINKVEGGRITRIGLVPWDNYGLSNSLFTWGWSFGGEFYNPDAEEVTPDDEYVVKALEWIVKFANDLGGPDKISVSPPNLQFHPFTTGNIGMAPLVTPNLRDAQANFPEMEIGSGLIPYQGPGASAPGAGGWLGGWSIFIPRGARNPDAAWDFIRWVSATDEGTQAAWETVGFPPAYRKAPVLDTIKNDPLMAPYYDTLVTAQHSRPAIPVGAFYINQIEQYVGEALYKRLSPLDAMRTVKQNTMREWERFNRQLGL